MIRIEVQDKAVCTRTVRSQKGDLQIREQAAWAFLFNAQGHRDPHSTRITLPLEQGQPGYVPGTYYLAPQSIYVKDRFGNLALGRPVLMTEDAYREQLLAQAA